MPVFLVDENLPHQLVQRAREEHIFGLEETGVSDGAEDEATEIIGV
jgi:hypothetical protein